MTPASEIALAPARAHSARTSDRSRPHGGRWERTCAVLGVCLPVPLLALTGLSIPLPAGVERIGAALVAWADASVDGADPLGLGDRGSIVLSAGERVLESPSGPQPDTARRVLASSALPTGAAPGGAKDGGTPPKDGSGGGGGGSNGGNGGGTTPTDPGGSDPGDDPGLVEETVKTVTEQPLVEEVGETLDESSDGLLEDTLSDLGL